MVKDDGEAANPKKTLDALNPEGKSCIRSCDGPNSAVSDKEVELEARVSVDGGGDDMSVTLAELSGKRGGKRGGKEASKDGDLGLTDEKIEDTSASGGGDDSVVLRRSRRKKIDVDAGDGGKKLELMEKEGEEEQKPDDEEEDEDYQDESVFSPGNFVWGKVKSHPWWPGRVFDPSHASEQALKYKHEGRILVAYFGDATFAWCDEAQLKPFVENFAEMSKQSGSKNFLNAVEEAVTEFGWLVELDMTCCCSTEQSAQHQESGLNAGIKGGVNVNKGGIGMYSVDKFNPAAFLDDLRDVGRQASVNSLLELTALRSRVSAIYRPKDRSLLLKFNEMQEAADDEGVGAGKEDSIRGPVEESVQIFSGTVKRKERSVAEILYGDEKVNEDSGVVDEGEKGVKTDSKSGRKKRKVAVAVAVADHEESLDEEISINQSRKREKKLIDISKAETEDKKKVASRLSNMKKPISVQTTNLTAFEESDMTPRTRERKKSKYLSPPYTNLEYFRQTSIKNVEASNVSQSGETSSKKDLPNESGAENGKANGSAPATPRRASTRKVGDDATKSIASSNNVLSGIRSAARSGQLSKGKAVKGFLSSYRSSKYQNESSSPHEESLEMINHQVVNDEEKPKPKKAKLRSKRKVVESEKDEGNKSLKKSTETKIIEKSAALHIKFPAGHPLPSNDDLVALYGKFGELDTSKTEIIEKSSSVRIVFMRDSDAEAACKSSKEISPFGAADVSYKTRLMKAKSTEKEVDENGFLKRKRLNKKQSKESASDGGLEIVKQKLEGMATMVAEADGKVSSELKSSLENSLKDLLEEVKVIPAIPSSSGSGV